MLTVSVISAPLYGTFSAAISLRTRSATLIGRQGDQYRVTATVAVLVIDLLEVVGVDHEDGHRLVMPLSPAEFGGAALLKAASVENSCQRIRAGEAQKLFRIVSDAIDHWPEDRKRLDQQRHENDGQDDVLQRFQLGELSLAFDNVLGDHGVQARQQWLASRQS